MLLPLRRSTLDELRCLLFLLHDLSKRCIAKKKRYLCRLVEVEKEEEACGGFSFSLKNKPAYLRKEWKVTSRW